MSQIHNGSDLYTFIYIYIFMIHIWEAMGWERIRWDIEIGNLQSIKGRTAI